MSKIPVLHPTENRILFYASFQQAAELLRSGEAFQMPVKGARKVLCLVKKQSIRKTANYDK